MRPNNPVRQPCSRSVPKRPNAINNATDFWIYFRLFWFFCFHSRCMRSNDAVSHDMRCGFLETRTVVGTPFVCTNCATLVQYHHLSNRITWQFLTLHAHGSQPLRWAQYIGHCVIFVYGFMCNKIQCHLSERRMVATFDYVDKYGNIMQGSAVWNWPITCVLILFYP